LTGEPFTDAVAERIRRKTLWLLLTFFVGLGLGLVVNGLAWMIGIVVTAWVVGALFGCSVMAVVSMSVWKWLIEERGKHGAGDDGCDSSADRVGAGPGVSVQGDQGLAGERASEARRVSGVPGPTAAGGAGPRAPEVRETKCSGDWRVTDASLSGSTQVVSPVTEAKLKELLDNLTVFFEGVPVVSVTDVSTRVALLAATFSAALNFTKGDRDQARQVMQPLHQTLRRSIMAASTTPELLEVFYRTLATLNIADLERPGSDKGVH